MPLDALYAALPPYAGDLRDTLKLLVEEDVLTLDRRWGCLLACACAVGEPRTLRAVDADAPLDADWRAAARTASALVSVNAVYYRAVHAMASPDYATLHARLKMTALGSPPIPKPDFELLCLAVSTVYGCGVCLDAHEKELRTRGTPPEQMQAALRIAAVVHGVARTLAAEAALAEGA